MSTFERAGGARMFRYAAILYAIGLALHSADHVRRGAATLSTGLKISGAVTTAAGVVAIYMILEGHRHAPIVAAIVGLKVAIGTTAVHLLPAWGSLSDSFPGASGTGVTAFSWSVVIIEVAGALATGLIGAWLATGKAGPGSVPASEVPAAR